MTDAAVLHHITRLPHSRANFKQLVREFGAKGLERTGLETALARLVSRGDLVEIRPGHYVAASETREYAVGRLHMHRDGYGFVIAPRPLPGICGDLYIPKDSANSAMHGDRVVARVVHIDAEGRAEGEILKVLGLEAGVNITVGLPVVRTSVDHGTAFDIAGQGVADERSLVEALRQAADLAPNT